MSTDSPYFVKNVLDRVKSAYNLPTDAKLADFLDVSASTVSAWRKRNSTDFKLLFKKCRDLRVEFMIRGEGRMFRDEHDPRNIQKPGVKEPANHYAGDPDQTVAEFERRIASIVHKIEHGPFSQGLKIRLVDMLLGIVDEELDELRSQSDPTLEKKTDP